MPKLAKARAEKVTQSAENADDSIFEPVEDGVYRIRLEEVNVEEVKNSKDPKLVGAPQWVWVFKMSPDDPSGNGSRFWYRAALPPEGAEYFDFLNSKFVAPFLAFGVSADTDTDDLVGRDIRADIRKIIAQQGKRKGEWVNQIEGLLPVDAPAAAGGGAEEDFDDF